MVPINPRLEKFISNVSGKQWIVWSEKNEFIVIETFIKPRNNKNGIMQPFR